MPSATSSFRWGARGVLGIVAALIACNAPVTTPDSPPTSSVEQGLTGQNGALTVSTANRVVNQYAVLAADVAAGATSLTITNAADFTATGAFTTGLAAGDLLLIYQPQGATIDSTDTAAFGTVSALGGAGTYELVHVASVAGTTISLETGCGGLAHAYRTAGATEVIRVPQVTTLTINVGASVVAQAWDGARGGVVAVQAQSTVTVNGSIDASGAGFRGGVIDNLTTGPPGTSIFRSANSRAGGEKGESIAGFQGAYDTNNNGRYGRGAPANGGGGGDAHNASGGGGANGDSGDTYTGAGVMRSSVVGAAAWNLDPEFISNGNALTTSSGGGRGGYTFAANNRDALTVAPGDALWGGDSRRDVGGFGGRPLTNDPATRLFLGGGGGAGDGNNGGAGGGGAGGGLVLLLANSVSGTGTVQSNGAVGTNTSAGNNDAPGGGGAGGTVVVRAATLAGVTLHADGGAGGNQGPITTESEGPGGGGGGGFIAVAGGAVTQTAAGALGGTTVSQSLTEFPSNGATAGAAGQTDATIASLPICLTDDLAITVTDGAATATPGQSVTYTIVATNNGADVVGGATIADTFPATLTGVTWTCVASSGSTCPAASGTGNISGTGTLANGGTLTFTATGTISPAATGSLANTATIAAPTGITDGTPGNNSATDTDALAPSADLAITVTDSPDPVAAGGALTYTVNVTNNGPSNASTLTVTDTLPTGVSVTSITGSGWACGQAGQVVTCTRATLAVGAAPAITIATTAPTSAGTITDTATVSATTTDAVAGNNSASQQTTVNASSDLSVTVTGAPNPVVAGAPLTYTINVSNAGPSAGTGVTVTDTLPAGVTVTSITATGWSCSQVGQVVTCTEATAAVGAQSPIVIATTAPSAGGSITDSVTVSASSTDPTPGNNTASATTTVTAAADLAIAVTDSPDPVTAAAALTYTVAVTNNGPSAATGVTVTDTLPAGVTVGSITATGWTCGQAGQVITCTRATAAVGAQPSIVIAATAPSAGGTITDTATVAATTADPALANNTASQSTTVTGSSDLSIAITDSPDPVTAGATLTYTVSVTNAGPSDAASVTVTDTLPAGATFVSGTGTGWSCSAAGQVVTCTRATAAVGAQPAITIAVTAPSAGGTITDTASVATTTSDPNSANNTASQTTTVTASADLAVALTDSPDPVTAGGTLTYTVAVTNNGPSTAAAVTVTDTLPGGTTFVSATGTGWACSAAGQVVTCTEATAPAGAQAPIAIVVAAPSAGGTITDTVKVASTTSDPTPGNNTASQSTTVTGVADLAIALTAAPEPVVAGAPLTYTATVTNNGPSPALGVTVTDTLPAGVTFTSATGTGWACSAAGQVVTCTEAVAATGAQPAITIVTTAAAEGGTITDTASVAAATFDPDTTNNSASVDSTVTASADVAIALTASPSPVTAGAAFTYTATVTNNGPSTAAGLTVSDTLPAGVTLVNASGTGWSCSANGQVVTCTLATAAAGALPPIAINVTAPVDATTLSDTATVATTTADPDPSNNSATVGVDVTASADLAITITAAPSPAPTGGALTYTVAVTNNGPSTATAVTVTDTLPAGVTFVSATGTGWTCSAVVQVVTCTAASLPAGAAPAITIATTAPATPGTVTDAATVAASTPDPALANNTATLDTTVAQVSDLAITLTAAPEPVTSGATLTYTIGVTNAGPSTAPNVVVVDTLPAGVTFTSGTGTGWTCGATGQVVTCTLASLPTGAAAPISIVTKAPTASGAITDTATVSSDSADANPANNTATVVSTVGATADVALTLTADPTTVVIGSTITYTLTVGNLGAVDASTVAVTDHIGSSTTLVSVAGDGYTCTTTDETIVCTRPTLAAGASTTITIVVTAPGQVGTVPDTAVVTSTTPDPVLANNSAHVDVDVTDSTGIGVRGGGCSTSGGAGAGSLLAVFGALAWTARRRRQLAVVAGVGAAALVVAPTAARAQVAGAPTSFSVERNRMALDGEGVGAVEWADVPARWAWNVATWLGIADDPLVVYRSSDNARIDSLVHERVGGSLQGAVGVLPWLELGLEIPLIYDQTSNGIEMLPTPASPKFGDIRIAPKAVLRRGGGERVSVAVGLSLTLPSGGSSDYAGDDGLTLSPELMVSRRFGPDLAFRATGNFLYLARHEATVANLRVDDELALRLGVGYRFADRKTGWRRPLELDLTGLIGTFAASPFDHINHDAYEIDASGGYAVSRDVSAYALAGMGIGGGFGVPDWRLTIGARFTQHAPEKKPRLDRDHDGIFDDVDQCPDQPEDFDSFQDTDGCPDPDNDGDGIPDTADKCPNEPEDKDGFQDEDGCPDPDNDGDGVPDAADKCPNEPEDKDGFQDEDGCPDPDNDNDGTLDAQDRCPLEPGPKENGGCPDPDRDGDGVVDRLDNCPDEKGLPENAGCPGKQLVKITDTKLEILESVYFKLDKAVIEARSFPLLDNVAQVLTSHTKLVIQVEGHTDSQGKPAYNKDLSQRRAQAVVEYLVKKGIDKARLTPIGYGQDKPVADNKTATGRAQNRRVVFTIVSGTDGAQIDNKQQGAGDDTKEPDKAPAPKGK